MWSVEFEGEEVEKEVVASMRAQRISLSDQVVIHAWIRQVSYHGPKSVRGDLRWADHALSGEWDGYRSSAFSNRGRIIYRILEKRVLVRIARITVDHNYRKDQKR